MPNQAGNSRQTTLNEEFSVVSKGILIEHLNGNGDEEARRYRAYQNYLRNQKHTHFKEGEEHANSKKAKK